MKNSADLGGCYPPRPLASVDNTLLDLQNSSYPTQPHSIIAKYLQIIPYAARSARLWHKSPEAELTIDSVTHPKQHVQLLGIYKTISEY